MVQKWFKLCTALVLIWVPLSSSRGVENSLEAEFRHPPHRSGIRCFWWWLNGNVTKEAITRDLEEMKAKGFNGALIFDADGSHQRGNGRVPSGPMFGSPEWTGLFVHACREAKRLDLELSLNIQSGWNLGGPKVSAEESVQGLTWSTTTVRGPMKLEQELPVPKHKDFYRDIRVLAIPVPGGPLSCTATASSAQGKHHPSLAMDNNQKTFWVSKDGPSPESPQWLLLSFTKPIEISELWLRGREGYGPRDGRIELSMDNKTFHTVKTYSLKDGQTLEAAFKPQKAKYIRYVFTSSYDKGAGGNSSRNVQVAEVSASSGGIIRPIHNLSLKNASKELGMSAPDTRHLLDTKPEVPGEVIVKKEEIVELTSQMDESDTLRWNVPAGDWVIVRMGHAPTGAHVSTQSAGWSGRVIDYLNPNSLHSYWNRNVMPLLEAIGPLAGDSFRYIHTDSWEGGGMNWTPGFDATFKVNRGYDILPWLAVLAGYVVDSRDDANAFLADFRKTVGDLVADHYGLLAELSKEHNLGTHPECSGPHAGPLDGIKNYGRSEIMMSEFWSPSPHRPKDKDRFFVKQASSAAHIYGKKLVGAEGLTTISLHWNDVPWSRMKPSFDNEFCAGLNLLFVHTFTCSPEEMGMPGQEYFAGTHFNPQITWWDEAPAFIDYIRRCQNLAQTGNFKADVLYYYGDHIPNISGYKGADPAGALPEFDYDVLCEEVLLSKLAVKGGRLVLPSGMEYRVLVLPDHGVLSLKALKKVDQLARAGALILGPKPQRTVSLEGGVDGKLTFQRLANGLWGVPLSDKGNRSVGSGRVFWGMTARELLLDVGIAPDVAFEGLSDGMDWIHYQVEGADVYFLSEQTGQVRTFDATFRVNGRAPELWNAVDGSIRKASTYSHRDGRTTLPLSLDPYGSLFVVFRTESSGDQAQGPNFAKWAAVQEITGPWSVRFDAEWGGPNKPVRFDALSSWHAHVDPGIKYYSGKAAYKTTFNLPVGAEEKSLSLALGKVEDVGIARVTLNGVDLGIVWMSPFRVSIAGVAKPGRNELEIEVVNSWRNRLLGDSKLPESERLTRTNIRVKKNQSIEWNLEPSGLLGPVRILEERCH